METNQSTELTKVESLPIANYNPEKDVVEIEIVDGEHILLQTDENGKPVKISQLREKMHNL